MKKKVFLTVNPQLLTGKRFSTMRSLATALHRSTDLFVLPVDGYDFQARKVEAYRRVEGGKFISCGMIDIEADCWIVWSDGYYLESRSLGFARHQHYFQAQMELYRYCLSSGRVGRVVNTPDCEERTLKGWLASPAAANESVVRTYAFESIEQVYALQENLGVIVAKPNWGGAGKGVRRLTSKQAVRRFVQRVCEQDQVLLEDYCFQEYYPGDEKRLWIVGGKCVASRIFRGRATPWSRREATSSVMRYHSEMEGFSRDCQVAEHLARVADLELGSVDFLGDKVNEINGAGTVFTQYHDWDLIVDARPQLTDYVSTLCLGEPKVLPQVFDLSARVVLK